MCVKYGLPAQSPARPDVLMPWSASRSLTLTCPALVRLDPGLLESDAVGVRRAPPPAARRCVPLDRAARPCAGERTAPIAPRRGSDGGPGQDLDPPRPGRGARTASVTSGSSRWIRAPLRSTTGHAAAEATEGLRQLEAHVAAAQDDQVSRELVQLPGPRRGSAGRDFREAGGVSSIRGPRPGVDHDGLAAERPGSRPR